MIRKFSVEQDIRGRSKSSNFDLIGNRNRQSDDFDLKIYGENTLKKS